MSKEQTLTPAVFYILLSLASKERHGYDIMKQVQADSVGLITMGPGTLYGSIKRMLADGQIKEGKNRSSVKDSRRIYYQLTDKGRKALDAEISRFNRALKVAGSRKLSGIGFSLT